MSYEPPFGSNPAHPPREMDKAFTQWAESISKENSEIKGQLEKVSTEIKTLTSSINAERLRVETASNHTENKVALIETQFELKNKELLRRIELLEDNNKWSLRTSGAALLGAIFAIAARYVKIEG